MADDLPTGPIADLPGQNRQHTAVTTGLFPAEFDERTVRHSDDLTSVGASRSVVGQLSGFTVRLCATACWAAEDPRKGIARG